MHPDDWHLTQDVDAFLAQAGHFLRSRAALHNMPLTDIEKLRTHRAAESDNEAAIFGRLRAVPQWLASPWPFHLAGWQRGCGNS
jgi:hypothetical protein